MSVCEKVEAMERQLLEDIHELSMKNEELILQLVESRVMSVLIQDIVADLFEDILSKLQY